MTKWLLPAVVGVAAAAALVVMPFVGWALDVNDEDAVIEAFMDHAGIDGDPDDICVLTDEAFPEVAVVAFFAHDRGCMTNVIYVDGDWIPETAASAPALALAGWDQAGEQGRADLALAWADFAVFAFYSPVTSVSDDFALPDTPAYMAPQAVPDGNGGGVVTLWVQEPAGMLPEAEYKLWELTFDRDGKMVRIRVLDQFTVQY